MGENKRGQRKRNRVRGKRKNREGNDRRLRIHCRVWVDHRNRLMFVLRLKWFVRRSRCRCNRMIRATNDECLYEYESICGVFGASVCVGRDIEKSIDLTLFFSSPFLK